MGTYAYRLAPDDGHWTGVRSLEDEGSLADRHLTS